MKAVVLVGGEGTRLRPLTETRPKPLVPFLDRPLLHQVLDLLGRHGVGEVVLSSPYLEEEFRAFIDARAQEPAITWVHEETPLGTCGAVVGALPHLDGTFVVCNGDVLTDMDLRALVARHRERGAAATIALTHVEDARPFGLVETSPGGRVEAFREKPSEPVPGDVNAGIYVLEPEALEGIPPGAAVSIERETFPDLIRRGATVVGVVSDAYWRDLGTPEAYLGAHLDALAGRVSGITADAPFLGPGARVAEDAAVAETVVLGSGCEVGAGAAVDRSVLHERGRVGPGARVSGCVLGREVEVGAGAILDGSVVGDGARVPPGARLRDARVSREGSLS